MFVCKYIFTFDKKKILIKMYAVNIYDIFNIVNIRLKYKFEYWRFYYIVLCWYWFDNNFHP